MVIISKKQFDAEISKAYLRGYECGVKTGELEALYKKYTPNQVRELMGLEPIKNEGEQYISRRKKDV